LVHLIDLDQDLFGLDSILVDKKAGNFYLKTNSPCIDAGLKEWGELFDLKSQFRNGDPDIGCYEFDPVLKVNEEGQELNLNIFPNPTIDRIFIHSELQNLNQMMIIDYQGQLVLQQAVDSFLSFDVSELPAVLIS